MPYATKPELDATKTPTLLDIAWAAGVYEGEGTVHQRRIASAQTEVVQKDPEILYRLRDWFGGSVGMQGGGSTPEAWRCHSWTVCGDRCRLFVALIYGYLSARRRAAIDATRTLEFLRGQSPAGMALDDIRGLIAAHAEARYSQIPRNIARRKRMTQEPWYIKRREKSAATPVADERVM